mmetsp:Transcript_17540/g.44114  ORF Transcript_17540/g.44114 Transcript_17540/m.44114 type:complete len:335 (+) Transcript_17540:565-1569(+)
MRALSKMACVARWSATTDWNSLFSCSRCWPAFLTSICAPEICTLEASISSSSFFMRLSRRSMLDCKSFFNSPFSYNVVSVLSISEPQWSLNVTSSACWSLRSAIILSMSSLTFAKASSCTAVANVASCVRGPAAAPTALGTARPFQALSKSSASKSGACAARRRAAAALRRSAEAEAEMERSWMKDTVAARCSRLSSSVRMAMASATATVSAPRVLLRFSHWSSKSLHVNFKLRKNSTSPERCCLVSPKFSLASESAFWLFACSTSISSSFLLPKSISSVFAAARALKSSWAFNSSCCSVVSSFSKSFCICWSTPKISEDLPEDRDSKGAGCFC